MIKRSTMLAALLLAGCNLGDQQGKAQPEAEEMAAAKTDERSLQQACASDATYDRLKELAFDEAARIRGDDARALDAVADRAVVRMENPVVQSRDEEMNVTLCSGRFVLELPPGTENAFDGQRQITADIEYAAQNAADGSGLVYQMEGAEPLIYRLATVGGLARAQAAAPPVTIPQPSAPPGADRVVLAERTPAPAPRPAPPARTERPVRQAEAAPAPIPAPRREAAARPARAEGNARPSFNCRFARTRTERMVCGSGGLAAQDRRMASAYYAELANADASTRQRLRATRDRFLARRERCGDPECVSSAYAEREAEIRAIANR